MDMPELLQSGTCGVKVKTELVTDAVEPTKEGFTAIKLENELEEAKEYSIKLEECEPGKEQTDTADEVKREPDGEVAWGSVLPALQGELSGAPEKEFNSLSIADVLKVEQAEEESLDDAAAANQQMETPMRKIKVENEELSPPEAKKPKKENDEMERDGGPVANLALAPFGCDMAPRSEMKNETQQEVMTPANQDAKNEETSTWYDIGVFKETSCIVTHFYKPNPAENGSQPKTDDPDNPPDYSKMLPVSLTPGTRYRFRVAAINSCGQGPWSDVAVFQTGLPGLPSAPTNVKIAKSGEGAHLSWLPPPNTTEEIIEYSTYLAVKSTNSQTQGTTATQLKYIRVYCGPSTQCTVANSSLARAHIDLTSKPAMIFRIAARNENGYGPAVQVRWLQDIAAEPKVPAGVKRPDSDVKLEGSAVKKSKSEEGIQ